MPTNNSQADLSAIGRFRGVTSILARGMVRSRNNVKSGRFTADSGAEKPPKTGLATCLETSLSGSLDIVASSRFFAAW